MPKIKQPAVQRFAPQTSVEYMVAEGSIEGPCSVKFRTEHEARLHGYGHMVADQIALICHDGRGWEFDEGFDECNLAQNLITRTGRFQTLKTLFGDFEARLPKVKRILKERAEKYAKAHPPKPKKPRGEEAAVQEDEAPRG